MALWGCVDMALIESNGEPIRLLNGETEMIDPAALKLHEVNPRQGDVGALCVSFRENGFWGAVVVDRRDGRVLAGNHRVMAARQLGMRQIPVQYVETDGEIHALRVLLADNRHSDLATYDNNLLAELLQTVNADGGLLGTGYDGDDLDDLLAELGGDMEQDDVADDESDDGDIQFWEFVQNAPRDEYDVPMLNPSLQGSINEPYEIWGDHSRATTYANTLFFYTDDSKFSSLKKWVVHISSRYSTVVEPNYSTDQGMPYPVVLYDIFEKRAISAWLQSLGCRIVVDINVVPEFFDVAILGVPREWRSWCLRAQRGDDCAVFDWFMAQIVAFTGAHDNVMCLYGGGSAARSWAEANGQPWIPEKMDVVKQVYPNTIQLFTTKTG